MSMTVMLFLVGVFLPTIALILPRRDSLHPNIRLFSQRIGKQTLLVTPSGTENDPTHCYTWSKCGEERKSIQGYACTECRSIYAKTPTGQKIPLPIIKVDTTTGDLLSLEPNHPHYCNPLLKDRVRGQNIRREQLNDDLTTRCKPAAARVNVAEKVTRRYAPYGMETVANIAAAAKGPSKAAFARSIQRGRKKLYPNITELSQLDNLPPIHSKFTLTIYGEETNDLNQRHLLWKDGTDAIFGCPYFTELFEQVDELFLDGTFKYRPSCSRQIYRIFGLINDTVLIPIFTITMSGQSIPDYEKVFNQISLLIQNRPIPARYAHFDHETAAVTAFRRTPCFQNTVSKMCVFHVRQKLHDRVKSEKLTRIYNDDQNTFVNFFVTMIGALQLVDLNFLNEALMVLQTHLQTEAVQVYGQRRRHVEKLERILTYYQTTWIGTSLGQQFYTASDLETNRTNNYAENYHGRQQEHFTQTLPPLGLFIYENRRLLNEEAQTIFNYLNNPDTPPPEKNSDIDNRIAAIKAKIARSLGATNDPVRRSKIFLKYLYKLGKAAGMSENI